MENVFRWGVIGTGIIANKVFREVSKTGRHRVAGVYSRTLKKAEAFSEKFGGAVYDSAEALLGSSEIDGVYIATPHSEHYRFAKLAAEFAKPALVEKAFTVNAAQSEALTRFGEEKGVLITEAMWMRFSPVIKTVKAWIDAGAIGTLKKLTADFSFNLHVGQSTERVTLLKYAGGALLDVGVYTVSLSEYLFGAPKTVECRAEFLDTGVDAKSFITLRYPDGLVSELKCGINGAIRNTATIEGDKGKIKIPLFFAMPRASVKAKNFRAFVRAKSGYCYEFDAFSKDVRAGRVESPDMPHKSSVAVMKILDACRAANDYRFPEEIERV